MSLQGIQDIRLNCEFLGAQIHFVCVYEVALRFPQGCFFVCVFDLFEIGSPYAVQADLELTMIFLLPK